MKDKNILRKLTLIVLIINAFIMIWITFSYRLPIYDIIVFIVLLNATSITIYEFYISRKEKQIINKE